MTRSASYNDCQVILPTGTCSSKYNGHCTGGPFNGLACIANPDRRAICDDGQIGPGVL